MSESHAPKHEDAVEEAIWSGRRRLSPVWIVPLVALLIGIVLIYQSITERGPRIEISFKSAAGIHAGKSLVKYKDVQVGKVQAVRFSDDLQSVIVSAELSKEMAPYLTEKTRFWVVRARLSANAVEGLDTLLSGAYISMEPHKKGRRIGSFKGMENPPIILDAHSGSRFILEADDRGSVQEGSPVYYKKIRAGMVSSIRLSSSAKKVLIGIFIQKPFDRLVRDTTHFWDASGIDASIGPGGVEIRTASLTAILSGGISFDNFEAFGTGKQAKAGRHFILFKSIKEARKITYNRELYFWVYFQDSIRGLKEGAPVEFRGVKIGEVVSFFLIGNAKSAQFKIPILIKIQPERFTILNEKNPDSITVDEKFFAHLIAKGFRAQLQSSSLITGDLLIDMNFYPDAEPVKIHKENGLYIFPSIPATLETLKSNLKSILERISAIPFEEIGKKIDTILNTIHDQSIPRFNQGLDQINVELLPSFKRLIASSNRSIEEIRKNYLDTNAKIHQKMLNLLDEITRTSRSIRNLSDYLERHPESIIRGK